MKVNDVDAYEQYSADAKFIYQRMPRELSEAGVLGSFEAIFNLTEEICDIRNLLIRLLEGDSEVALEEIKTYIADARKTLERLKK